MLIKNQKIKLCLPVSYDDGGGGGNRDLHENQKERN